jgi:deoxyribodipyrimidine photo-lyase
MSELILFWHRRDLRTVDNVGLAAARARSPRVVGVFCLDPALLVPEVAPARVTYMIGSLQELQERYDQAGSRLLVIQGQPQEAIPRLAKALSARALFLNRDVEPYGRQRDRTVADTLRQAGVEVQGFWDQLLHPPDQIRSGSGTPYTVYTPFWRNWNNRPKAEPAADLVQAEDLTEKELAAAESAGAIALPSARDLGYVWDNPLVLEPGTAAALERLEEFCDRAITDYQEQRNFPFAPGTSRLSAALKFGTIGIRSVWAATAAVLEQTRSDEAQEGICVWRQELAWREFYQHALYHFPELAEGAYRKLYQTFPWDNNPEYFQAWCEGRTGYPIVDAAMRQMNTIGWMHNRCRMIVASFLTKDLLVDGRMGEKYFMQKLMDGDLSANNGGWQWSTSSGMDPKPLRIFNPASQAQKFDPEAEYIREWLPELRSLDTGPLVTGNIPQDERDRCGYPAPIVDHKRQQALFKQRYAQQKERMGESGSD